MTPPCHITRIVSGLGLLFSLAATGGAGSINSNQMILVLKPSEARQAATLSAAQLSAALGLSTATTIRDSGFTRWRRDQLRRAGKDDVATLGAIDSASRLIIQLPAQESATTVVSRLKAHPWVRIAERDGIGEGGGIIPADPNFGIQWHHTTLHSTNAWGRTRGTNAVTLAIIDTGIRTNLAEFAGRLVPGYDFVNSDSDPADDNGHGTAVAGAAAANASNGILIAGVDWNCRIMPVKVLNAVNFGNYSWWADGIDWAVSNGAKVINISAGGATWSDAVALAISNAIAAGVIVVTITHNDGAGTIRFPGSLPACITVGATSNDDSRATFSNYGPEIDLVAPGAGIVTFSNTTAQYWSGTSFAAPLVSGLCGLLASLDPALTQTNILALLVGGSEDGVGDGTDTPGFDNYHGHGRVNAEYTLQLAETAFRGIAATGGQVRLEWSAPPSVSNHAVFAIDYGDSTTSGWARVATPSNLVYDTNGVEWTDTGAQTGSTPGRNRHYRLVIQ